VISSRRFQPSQPGHRPSPEQVTLERRELEQSNLADIEDIGVPSPPVTSEME
jgi:hypothetical protein